MPLSDKVLASTLRNAIRANRESRDAADEALRVVHATTSDVPVCKAHNGMVELVNTQLEYLKALNTGFEVLMDCGATMLEEKAEKKSLVTKLTYLNILLVIVGLLIQAFFG